MDEDEDVGNGMDGKDDVQDLNLLLDQANEVLNANNDYERTLVEMSTRIKERISANAGELQARQAATKRLKQELKHHLSGQGGEENSDQLLQAAAALPGEIREEEGGGAVRGWVRGRPLAIEDILATEMDKALDSVLAEHDHKQQLKLLRTLSARRMAGTGEEGKHVERGILDNDDAEEILRKPTFTIVVIHNQVETSEFFGQVQRFVVPNSTFTFRELQETAEQFWKMERAFTTTAKDKRNKAAQEEEKRTRGKRKQKKTAAAIVAEMRARSQGNRISAHILQNEGGSMYLDSAAIQQRLAADIRSGVIEDPKHSGAPGVSLFLVVRERLDLNELRAFRPGRVAWKRQLRLLRQRRKQRLRIHLMQGGTLENANVETLNSLKDLDDDELAELSAHEHKGAATLLKRVFAEDGVISFQEVLFDFFVHTLLTVMVISVVLSKLNVAGAFTIVRTTRNVLEKDGRFGPMGNMTFSSMTRPHHVWDWLNGPMSQTLYPLSSLERYSVREVGENTTVTETFADPSGQFVRSVPSKYSSISGSNIIFGGVRIRQVRVQKNCGCVRSTQPDCILEFPDCVGYYSSSCEDTVSFGPLEAGAPFYENNTIADNVTASNWINAFHFSASPGLATILYRIVLGEPFFDTTTFLGHNGWYGAGGYFTDISRNVTEYLTTVKKLEEMHFIDQQTRAVLVVFNVYNPNFNLYASVQHVIDFLPSGAVVPTLHVNVVPVDIYDDPVSRAVASVEVIMACIVLYLVVFHVKYFSATYAVEFETRLEAAKASAGQ